ncbi:MAG TPA: alpha/beta hydrolase [Rhizomicrobium sp.]|jgi:pimeloyl-ACP methyl ester carboxylesterase
MRKILVGLVILIALAIGAVWFFSVPDIPRGDLEAKYAKPPSQFVMLPDGARAHIRDQGPRDAPVLVLVHGSNASLFTWVPWVSRLDKDFRVVTLDMPGHGLTGAVPNGDYSQEGMVAFTLEVADKLHLAKFALGGNSMGGGVAARFAEEHPDRVTHLILVDAAGMKIEAGDRTPLAFRIARTPVVNQMMLYVTPRSIVTEGLNDAIIHKEIINDQMIDLYWDFARMQDTRAATLKRFTLPLNTNVETDIGKIKAPTLILWGEQDHLIPVAAAHKFNNAIAGSKLIVYPATGHIPMEEVPDESAKAVHAFLNGT